MIFRILAFLIGVTWVTLAVITLITHQTSLWLSTVAFTLIGIVFLLMAVGDDFKKR